MNCADIIQFYEIKSGASSNFIYLEFVQSITRQPLCALYTMGDINISLLSLFMNSLLGLLDVPPLSSSSDNVLRDKGIQARHAYYFFLSQLQLQILRHIHSNMIPFVAFLIVVR